MRRKVIAGVCIALVVAGVHALAYAYASNPSKIECIKPTNGFLIIESVLGYNDSIGHGAPQNHWPIINARQGQTVNIVVCNTDNQAHALQIEHYFDTLQIEVPNQAARISFVANQTGTFQIYVGIFDSLQSVEQSGQLIVSA